MATTFTIQSHTCSHCAKIGVITVASVNDSSKYFCWDCLEQFKRGIEDAQAAGWRSVQGASGNYDTANIQIETGGQAHFG